MVAAAAAGVWLVSRWGQAIGADDPRIRVSAPPFVGTWALAPLTVRHVAPVLVAAAVVTFGPEVARRLRWTALVVTSAIGSSVWAVSLAVSDGWDRLASPLESRYEYLAAVREVTAPASFLRTFVERLPTYPTHVKGHPPGMVLLLWSMDVLGLRGSGWAAALVIGGAGLAVAAVLVTAGDLAGRDLGRRLAPFLVLSPAAVWVATSADALFAGVGAAAVAVSILAIGRRGWRSAGLAVGGGLLFALVALLSYGLVLFGLIPLAVSAYRRRPAPLVLVGATAAVALVAVARTSGFWFLDGLSATRALQLAGVASRRPQRYFAVANVAASVVCVGPAAVAALPWLRRLARPGVVLVMASAAAVAVADASGFSKGEVERIWLPFFPWLTIIVLCLPRSTHRWWLAANAATGIALQVALRTPW